MCALGDQIRLMRKFGRCKQSYLYHLLFRLQSGAPLPCLFVKMDAK